MDVADGVDDVDEALPLADVTGDRPRDIARIVLDGMQEDAAQVFLPEAFRLGVDGNDPLEMKVRVLALFENLEVGVNHLEFELIEAGIAREDDTKARLECVAQIGEAALEPLDRKSVV
jgi:hypothetical protein